MKKEYYLIIGFIIVTYIISIFVFNNKMNDTDAIKIGEEKYLEFLWVVDGAFNNDLGGFKVNGKELAKEKKTFTCKYDKKTNNCIGEGFEDSFKNLFANHLSYDNVYSDGKIYTWYSYEKEKYKFDINHNCSIDRMPLNQELVLEKIEKDTLTYKVIFQEENKTKESKNTFELIKENNKWKINKAYYHDLCGLDYYIK